MPCPTAPRGPSRRRRPAGPRSPAVRSRAGPARRARSQRTRSTDRRRAGRSGTGACHGCIQAACSTRSRMVAPVRVNEVTRAAEVLEHQQAGNVDAAIAALLRLWTEMPEQPGEDLAAAEAWQAIVALG